MNELTDHNGDGPLQVSGLDLTIKAEIDMAVSTAHAYPRRLSMVASEITGMVTMTPQSAEMCIYSLPRAGRAITGPSIRLAEILANAWGNNTTASRITEVNRTEGYVEAEGVHIDFQKNARTVRRVRRRITNKTGKVYDDDMILVTGQAASSIALRNAILAGVPRFIWQSAYDAAEQVLRGDIKTLGERHEKAMKSMAAFGLSADEVYKVLGVAGKQDFGLDHIVTLTGLYNSLKDGETTKEQLLAEMNTVEQAPRAAGAITSAKKTTPTLAAQQEERKAKAEVKSDPAPADDADKAREAQIAKREAQKAARDKAAEEKPAEKVREIEEPKPVDVVDEETGEVTEAPNEEAFMALYDTIVEDMMGAIGNEGIEEVLTLYEVQIDHMKTHFPDMHKRLMEEVDAAKE